MSETKHAVVLCSGGLDSTTILAVALSQGYQCHTLAFDYGQRSRSELLAAEGVSKQQGAADHKVVQLDLGSIGGSALTDDQLDVPQAEAQDATVADGIPITYVPARNTVFLSVALAYAEVLDAQAIFIGVNAVDYSGYPDCRPEYIKAYADMAALATKSGVEGNPIKIETPLIALTKGQIVELGASLNVDYSSNSVLLPSNSAGEALRQVR
ncbi:UNVERIFIED_CONTAM: hypothetical protein GTU68_067202 [Idotea baltica]|nr:hypothetical protein [Idotea baltica]